MHRALLVQEIVRAIMSWVESPGAALAFALSSRMLAEAGLEAVWRHGDAWELAMTMPERFYKIETMNNGGRLLTLTDTPRPTGWLGPRFHLYSRAMRTLSVKRVREDGKVADADPVVNREHDAVHPAVIEAWAQNDADRKVFPLLRELRVDWPAELGQTIMLALASPSLRTLRLRFATLVEAATPGVNDVFRALPRLSADLQCLTLKVDFSPFPCDGEDGVACIRGWKKLQDVDLCATTTHTLLNALANATQLHTLKMRSPGPDSPASLHPFPALCDLKLTCCDLATATQLISAISSASLRHVVIYAPSRSARTPAAFVDLARALSRHAELETVRILQAGRTIQSAYRPPSADLQELIAPLLSLARLRCLALILPPVWSGGEEVIASAAQAWPELAELDICIPGYNLAISLHTFALVLGRCPRLRVFNVAIDLSSPIPAVAAPPAASACANRALAALRLTARQDAPEFEVAPLVEFLHAACPAVRCRECRGTYARRRPKLPQVARVQELLDELMKNDEK